MQRKKYHFVNLIFSFSKVKEWGRGRENHAGAGGVADFAPNGANRRRGVEGRDDNDGAGGFASIAPNGAAARRGAAAALDPDSNTPTPTA